jgi:hypothetical protein
MVARGCDDVQPGLGARLHLAVQENLAALVKETDLHRTGVPVNAAVIVLRCGVESPAVSSS